MKELRVRCKGCGVRFTVVRVERERTPAYCVLCQEERKRAQGARGCKPCAPAATRHEPQGAPCIPWLLPESCDALVAHKSVTGSSSVLATSPSRETARQR